VIIVDSEIWTDFWLERPHTDALVELLEQNVVLAHELVLEELALGTLGTSSARQVALDELRKLPMAPLARLEDVLALVEHEKLAGIELHVVGAHLLSSARLAGARLWTRDKKLAEVAERLGHLYR
jgi:predicted nucleic acid-binding protein